MKKRRFCIIAIIAGILGAKSASAAEDIVIGGQSFPLIIVGPVIVVILAWIILLILWIVRNRHNIALVFYNLGRLFETIGAKIGIKKLQERVEEYKRRKEEEAKAKQVALLSEAKKTPGAEKEETVKKDLTPYIERVEAIEAQLPRFNESLVFKNLTATVRSFFAALLNMNYEFTEQELIDRLEQKKKGLVGFARKLSDIKYSGQELTKADLLKLTDEFKKIIEHYVKAGWSKKRVAKGSVEKLIEEDKKILSNIRSYIDFLKNESRKRQIEKLLADETKVLSRNIKLIKQRYNRILAYYVQLTPDEKTAVYPQLIAFYKNINKALFSTVYSEKSKKELEYFAAELARLKDAPAQVPFLIRLKRAFRKKETPAESIPETAKKPAKLGKKEKEIIKTAEAKKPLPSMQPLMEKLKRAFRLVEVPTKEVEVVLDKLPPEVPIAEEKISTEEIKKLAKAMPNAREPAKAEAKMPTAPEAKKPSEAAAAIESILETATITKIDYMKKLKGLLSQGWFELASKNVESAEKTYNDILLCYSSISKAEQKLVFKQVTKLFKAIKAERDKLLEAEIHEKRRMITKLKQEEANRKKKEKEAEKQRKLEERRLLLSEKRKLEAEQRKLAEEEKKRKLQERLAKAAATRFANKMEELVKKKEAERRQKIEEARKRQLEEMSEKWRLGKVLEREAAKYKEKKKDEWFKSNIEEKWKIADALKRSEMRALEAEKKRHEKTLEEMKKRSAEEQKRIDEQIKRQKALEEKLKKEEEVSKKKEEAKKKAKEALSKLEAEELKLMAELEMLKRKL